MHIIARTRLRNALQQEWYHAELILKKVVQSKLHSREVLTNTIFLSVPRCFELFKGKQFYHATEK